MTARISEISDSIVMVIPKKFSSFILFIKQCIGHTVKYYLKPGVLNYRLSL